MLLQLWWAGSTNRRPLSNLAKDAAGRRRGAMGVWRAR